MKLKGLILCGREDGRFAMLGGSEYMDRGGKGLNCLLRESISKPDQLA